MKPKERVLHVLLRILNNPGRYTRKQLAEQFGCSKDAIREDEKAINSLGEIELEFEKPAYTYRINVKNRYTALDKFRPLSEEDRYLIINALYRGLGSNHKASLLESKIKGLYDFQQLGLRQLRHPAIMKINRLETAKAMKSKVKLVRYRSNSNQIKDRIAEPFVINPELDTLQAYDYHRGETRHFRLSRIERVQLLEESWEMEHRHESRPTDVFRIRDINQVTVKLRLSVYAYNVLLETYPMAATYVDPDPEQEEYFIFQAQVNAGFKGILNFVMGYSTEVEVLAPQALCIRMQQEAQRILAQY